MASLPDPTATLTGEARAIYEDILARREARGVHHLGPYIPLLNHPKLARLIEQLGYFYKYESVLPRGVYQFIVLTIDRQALRRRIRLGGSRRGGAVGRPR